MVKAIETTRSRGRLYRKAGDRAHAAEVLRAAARPGWPSGSGWGRAPTWTPGARPGRGTPAARSATSTP